MDISVAIPVYNSSKTLRDVVTGVSETLEELNKTFEFVLTDDSSSDGVWDVIQEMHKEGRPIVAFRLMRNYGQHHALKCSLDHCSGRYVITMDDDLQHPPKEVAKLVQAADAHPEMDVIIGDYESKKHSLFRNFGTYVNTAIRNRMFPHARGLAFTSFRIVNHRTIEQLKLIHHANPRIGLMLLTITDRIMNVEVHHETRKSGRSGYTLGKMVKNTFDNMINYSDLPLKFVGSLGLVCAVISILLSVYYAASYVLGYIKVSGFTTLVMLTLLLSGALLFSVGLTGEYLSRIVAQQLISTEYHVRNRIGRTRVARRSRKGRTTD